MDSVCAEDAEPGGLGGAEGGLQEGQPGQGGGGEAEQQRGPGLASLEQLGVVAHLAELHHQVHQAGHAQAASQAPAPRPGAEAEAGEQLLHADVLLEAGVEQPLADGEGAVHQHLHLLRQLVLNISLHSLRKYFFPKIFLFSTKIFHEAISST